MPQDGEHRLPIQNPPMPPEIAIAVLKAIESVESATMTGEGERGTHTFKYASINDVLEAAHGPMKAAGLHVTPIEFSYAEQVIEGAATHQLWAQYGFQFRYLHSSGVSWVDREDTRHISILITPTGMSAGKAQSLATRDYLKGLLRIRTAEPDVEGGTENASPAQKADPVNLGKPKGPPTMPFVFDKTGKMAPYDAVQIKNLFEKNVAPLSKAERDAWESTNRAGLEQLFHVNQKTFLQVKKGLERE